MKVKEPLVQLQLKLWTNTQNDVRLEGKFGKWIQFRPAFLWSCDAEASWGKQNEMIRY